MTWNQLSSPCDFQSTPVLYPTWLRLYCTRRHSVLCTAWLCLHCTQRDSACIVSNVTLYYNYTQHDSVCTIPNVTLYYNYTHVDCLYFTNVTLLNPMWFWLYFTPRDSVHIFPNIVMSVLYPTWLWLYSTQANVILSVLYPVWLCTLPNVTLSVL